MKKRLAQANIDNYKVKVFAELEKRYGTEFTIYLWKFISHKEIICAIKNEVTPTDFVRVFME